MLFEYIDLYCERTAPGLWNEPINAASNLAFPAAALWAAITARRLSIKTTLLSTLIWLAAAIGLGSALFHTFANAWSEWADVVPIWGFVALYIFAAVHLLAGVAPGKLLRIGLIVAVCVIISVLATTDSTDTSPPLLNGSLQYAPALIALIVFSLVTARRKHPLAPWAAAATLTFAASLTLRTLDPTACAAFPIGTHFGWHLLNGLMVGLLLQALIRGLAAQQTH